MLRDEAQSQTDVGRHVESCQRAGKLVEDSLVASVILSRLFRLEREGRDGDIDAAGSGAGAGDDGNDNLNMKQDANHNNNLHRQNPRIRIGYILDGFPRTLQQAQFVHHGQSPSDYQPWPRHLQINAAVHLDVPEIVCQEKMMGRRLCLRCKKSWNVANVLRDGFVLPPTLPITTTTSSSDLSSSYSSTSSVACRDCEGERSWVRRDDDTVEIFQKRMEEYRLATEPLIDYFRGRDWHGVSGDVNDADTDVSVGCDKRKNGNALIRFVPFRGVQDMPLLEQLIWDRFVLTTDEERDLDGSSRILQK